MLRSTTRALARSGAVLLLALLSVLRATPAFADPPENDTCASAIVLDRCAPLTITGDNTEATNNYDPLEGGCTGRTAAGRDVVFAIDLDVGERILASYTTSVDGAIYLVTQCGNVMNGCLWGIDKVGPGQTEVFDFTSEKAARCYLILDSFGEDTGGTWTLQYEITCLATGACCVLGGGCSYVTEATCGLINGVYLGDDVPCMPRQCPELGACCLPWGVCQVLDEGTCLIWFNAAYMGNDVACDPDPCFAMGACCYPDSTAGTLCEVVSAYECGARNGGWSGVGTDCEPSPCQGNGACCLAGGACEVTGPLECEAAGGTFLGAELPCDPNPCPIESGACCQASGPCQIATPIACAALGGEYKGANTTCQPTTCTTPVLPHTWGRIKARYR